MKFALGHDKRSISNDDLLTDLQRIAAEYGEQQVKQRTYGKYGKYGVTTVIRRYGSWNAAVEAAGLVKTVERNVPDEKLFSALYDLWVLLGRQPSYSEVRKPACAFSATAYERRFGSWRQALEAFVQFANFENLSAPTATIRGEASKRGPRCPDLRLRFKVFQRDRFCCCSCGASPALQSGVVLHVDHIKPWSKGGETCIENLQTLCSDCNQGKTNHHEE